MTLNSMQIFMILGAILVAVNAMFIDHQNEFKDSYKSDMDLQKRGLSIRGDLQALARMLNFRHIKRIHQSVNPSRKQLIDLGKRNEQTENEDSDEGYKSTEEHNHGQHLSLQKRRRLSINGALQSLADMLATSGRNRLSEEVSSNKNRLLGLGR